MTGFAMCSSRRSLAAERERAKVKQEVSARKDICHGTLERARIIREQTDSQLVLTNAADR